MVGPKLSLSVAGAQLPLSQNFARRSKFRVCVSKPRGGFPFGLGKILPFSPNSIPALASAFTTAVMVPDCPLGRGLAFVPSVAAK